MSQIEKPLFGAIEAGGTKFVVAVGTSPDNVVATSSFPTSDPTTTIRTVMDFFQANAPEGLSGIGIAAFGPIDIDPLSATYGVVRRTPKPGWSGFDYRSAVSTFTDAPVNIDSDVNAAARGEMMSGAATGLTTFLYLTVGTGIGGGMMVDGRPLTGSVDTEMGHVAIPRAPSDNFAGICPFHGDCLEGMASGPTLEKRWGRTGSELNELRDQATEVEAWYLGTALASFTLTLAPQRIVLGGGVFKIQGLIEKVRDRVHNYLNGYVHGLENRKNLDKFVVPPGLGDRSGITGALALAMSAEVPHSN